MTVDFFIVGAQKAGTTSIHNYLQSLNTVCLPILKELKTFSDGQLFENDFRNLNNYYDCKGEAKVFGLSDVHLLFFAKEGAQRIYSHNPNAKIIITLRNPVDRAFSSYTYSSSKFFVSDSFWDTIDRADKGAFMEGATQDEIMRSLFIEPSLYYQSVKEYIDVFGSNVKVLVYEEFFQNIQENIKEILSFLEVDEEFKEQEFFNHNRNVTFKNKFLAELLFKQNVIKKTMKGLIPLKFRFFIRNTFKALLIKYNSKSNTQYKEKLSESDRKKMFETYFEDDLQKLSELLGRDFLTTWSE